MELADRDKLPKAISDSRMLRLQINLQSQNLDNLRKLTEEQQDPGSPNYHRWLTRREFRQRFALPKHTLVNLKLWLHSQKFRIIQADQDKIVVEANARLVEDAFSIHIATSTNGILYASTDDPLFPARFVTAIGSIDGLNNITQAVPFSRRLLYPSSGFKPSDFHTFYDELPLLNAGIMGSDNPLPKPHPKSFCGIAIAATSDVPDIAIQWFNNLLLKRSVYQMERVFPDNSNPGRTGDNRESEALLDVDWSTAVAPGARIRLYISSTLASAIKGAISDNNCPAIDISYGYCAAAPSLYHDFDNWFARAAAQGQSVFVSAGDIGSAQLDQRCMPSSTQGVSELAASQNVVAVGGTKFAPNLDASGNDVGSVPEQVWQDTGANGAIISGTGGGKSKIFSKPSFQTASTPSDSVRDIPDVSFGASPAYPGFMIYAQHGNNLQLEQWGGTSIAAPMWAGVSRLIAQAGNTHPKWPNPRLGNMNSIFYKLGPSEAALGFRDVTVGNNAFQNVSGYSAVAGYDLATGWGTVDIATFVNSYKPYVCNPLCPTSMPSPPVADSKQPAHQQGNRVKLNE
ncbi:S53 family peptidase [Rhizobium sp. AG207R]|uniref:S53 family peptidase n=1 Tax=Rhizobium sp. AG207R TaxID=2802287 RepID=UPI0022ABD8CB|nr:S53 family peptidase [Rhizobium sp. AG207R]MCZ3378435.1 S8/S53 family peptidase [Rhizobium sp. AG207R]